MYDFNYCIHVNVGILPFSFLLMKARRTPPNRSRGLPWRSLSKISRPIGSDKSSTIHSQRTSHVAIFHHVNVGILPFSLLLMKARRTPPSRSSGLQWRSLSKISRPIGSDETSTIHSLSTSPMCRNRRIWRSQQMSGLLIFVQPDMHIISYT